MPTDKSTMRPRGDADGETIFDAYALLEGGRWFAVVRCVRDGVQLRQEVILRETPQASALDAIALARAHAERLRHAACAPDA